MSTTNAEVKKQMYSTLNSEEKVFAWQYKYNQILKSKSFNANQEAFIIKLTSILNKEIFESSASKVAENFKKIEPTIKAEALDLFGISAAYELLATLNLEISNKEAYPPGVGDCDCSKTSDWCGYNHACLREGCTFIRKNCGTWLNYDCDGDCWIGSSY